MKDSFFRSMTWMHTWVGLLVCWLLYLIFFAGTVSFFRDEITLWSKPALHDAHVPQERIGLQHQQIIAGVEYLKTVAPESNRWGIYLPSEREPWLIYAYEKPRPEGKRFGGWNDYYINPETGAPIQQPRETKGGNFFYRLHFDLHYIDVRTARWIVCFASLFMLVALISGVVIHKRIFKDMFSFRKNKGSRSWLDGHNVSSVLALPFHIMITYTGLITLIFMLFPYPAMTAYDNGVRGLFNDVLPTNVRTQSSAESAPLVAVETVLDQVYTNWPNADITQFAIRDPNTASATITVRAATGTQVRDQTPTLLFNGVDGSLMAKTRDELSATEVFYDSLTALHTGRLANPLLRWLYFLCGVAGCVMIATGCIMWAKRIRERMKKDQVPSFGLKLVEGLNLATLMGLPVATSAFFIANRLLPITTAERADKEILVFFVTWLAVALFALFKRAKQQWIMLAWVNCIACISISLVNALTTNGNLISYVLNSQWALFSFDLMCLISAVLFIVQAKKLRTQLHAPTAPFRANRAGKSNLREQNT
ncbi:PepSY domain-containing protein [Pseudoalteromonas shioyasakiensis]|uniref:PepSY-associated TM helix domain-containing protein n=1 Tax=Pseudoalteromonas shioyasakiensis TaxID=1190813 RepID=UPI002117F0B5|nr:PepSY-associated TM helix domain-containing protein [Pseudoalteromonas shioyasakiensis]MCQ8878264.1 PepSY domain-containing protein [Pseudoalteromonas shioyasakiensis]